LRSPVDLLEVNQFHHDACFLHHQTLLPLRNRLSEVGLLMQFFLATQSDWKSRNILVDVATVESSHLKSNLLGGHHSVMDIVE
jgi:hypothetical protein